MGGLLSKWTDGEREAPAPLEGPVNGTVIAGTVLWFLLFVGQLPFYGWFEDRGHTWWIWTCAAGTGLGLFGLWYIRHREAAARREAARRAERPVTPPGDTTPPAHPAPDARA